MFRLTDFSLTDCNTRMVTLGVGALTAGIAIGYNLVRKGRGKITKSWSGDDPITNYIKENSLHLIPAQEKLIEETKKHSMGRMLGDTVQVQFLQFLCKTLDAKKTLDIGVLTGYSALSIALVLPEDGTVVACDVSEEYTAIGRPYWKEAGVAHKIDLRIAPATQTLQHLIERGEEGTFDFAFIDADRENKLAYYEYCLKLVRKGGIIVLDNSLQGGHVADPSNKKEYAETTRHINSTIAQDPRVDISFLWVGDGTTLCRVK